MGDVTTSSTRPLQLAVCQYAPYFGDPQSNVQRITDLARSSSADLLLLPELALTGYDVRDRVHELALWPAALADLLSLPAERALALGFIERSQEAIPYNAAALLAGSTVLHTHRKIYLPTYGMFDEARYFGRGQQLRSCTYRGLRIGLLVCEDFWHPALAWLLACQRIDLLLVLAAAPGRGVWHEQADATFASTAAWERIARTTALFHGIYVALCNRVGVEGGVTFAGGSLVAGPDGSLLGALAGLEEGVLDIKLDPAEIARARRPYAHLRDEDPHFVLRALQHIVSATP